MDSLPNENLQVIFRLLSLENKMECMLVCRLWADLLRSRTLLDTVNICSYYVFKKFIMMLEKDPEKGRCIDRLILHDCVPEGFDTRRLLVLCPRIQVLLLKPGFQLHKTSGFPEDMFDPAPPNQRVEYLMDFGAFELTIQLLASGTNTHIKTLELARPTLPDYGQAFIPLFKSFKFLTKLHMWDGMFTIKDFEDIHSKLPSLEIFEASELLLITQDIPRNIEPATSIKTLTVHLSENMTHQSTKRWLQYLRRKYTSLEHLTTNTGDMNDDISQELESFLQQLGGQLKTLGTIDVPPTRNIFEKMDRYGCQIQDLSLSKFSEMALLAASNQRTHIQTLSLFQSIPVPLECWEAMTALRKIELYFNFVDDPDSGESLTLINLHQLLEACTDTLESLTIQNAEVDWDFMATNEQFPSLKDLRLCFCTIPEELDRFITKRLPKLKSLILERNTIDAENESLILPNHHLHYLSIDPVYSPHYANISVTTLNDHKQRLYSFNRGVSFINDTTKRDTYDMYFYETVKPVPFENVDIGYLVTIVCASINTLIVDNKLAYQ